jgi:chaperonin cofactor prefoldin
MDFVGPAINAAVVAAVGLILAWLGRGRFEAADRRIDRLEERLDHRVDGLEQRMDAFQASLDAMRSDLTQVALAVGVRRPATNA